jgi:transposase
MSPKLPDSMPWEIYQAYLSGPAAVMRLFEQTFGQAALYGPPDPEQQQRSIDALSEDITRLTAQIERLQEEKRELSYRNFQLQRRNSELEAQLAKDSHNSSRPPSSDHPALKRTRSLRLASGRRPGGQAGHHGSTRRMSARPDRIVEHRPQQCRSCQSSLTTEQVVRHLRQQVIELVPARLRVTEHRLALLRCPSCGKTTKGEFRQAVRSGVQYGAGVKARVLYLQQYQLLPYARTAEAMRELFGCQLSSGTIANIVRECSVALLETELKIKQKLRRAGVIHADETGLRVAKRGQYIHVASNASLTHYAADSRRGRAAMDEIGILPKYRGTCVHDGWWSYDYYTKCRHALCGAHLLRELTFFAELSDGQRSWAEPLKELLLAIKSAVERVRESGGKRLGGEAQASLTCRYDELVRQGLELNPEAARNAPPMDGFSHKQARNLLLRFKRRKEEVLRFMTDFAVPFDRYERRSQRQRSPVPPNFAFGFDGSTIVTPTGGRPNRVRGFVPVHSIIFSRTR